MLLHSTSSFLLPWTISLSWTPNRQYFLGARRFGILLWDSNYDEQKMD